MLIGVSFTDVRFPPSIFGNRTIGKDIVELEVSIPFKRNRTVIIHTGQPVLVDHHLCTVFTKVLGQLGPPHGDGPCNLAASRGVLVDNVAVSVMLDLEAAAVEPVVEDLAAENVPPDAPDALPVLLGQPLVADELRVEVSHLVRAVVDVCLLDLRRGALQEHDVVIGPVAPEVEVHERQHVDVAELRVEQDVRMHQVEVRRVEVQLLIEFLAHVPEVAQLVYQRRSLVVSLELAQSLLLERAVVRALRVVRRRGDMLRVNLPLFLSIHDVHERPVGPRDGHQLPSPGDLLVQRLHRRPGDPRCLVELGLVPGHEGRAHELGFTCLRLRSNINVRISPIAPKIYGIPDSLLLDEAKILRKLRELVEVRVLEVDMAQPAELDLGWIVLHVRDRHVGDDALADASRKIGKNVQGRYHSYSACGNGICLRRATFMTGGRVCSLF